MKTFKYLLTSVLAIGAISAFAGDPIILTDRINELDAAVSQSPTEDNGWVTASVTETNGVLTGVTVTLDASKYDAAGAAGDAVDALDSVVTHTAGADGLAITVAQTNGVLVSVTGSIASGTYDADGAAATAKSEVIGDSTDSADADTIYGAKAYADSVAAAQDITITEGTSNGTIQVVKGTATNSVSVHGLGSAAYTDSDAYDAAGTATAAVEALDTSSDVTIASKSGNVVTLKAGVSETDGVIAQGSGDDITLDDVAVTGAAADLSVAADADSGISAGSAQDTFEALGDRITTLEIADPSSDIDARIILAITNGITVNGVSYKLVVDPAGE